MNNVFATSSSVLSAKTLKRQSGRKVKLLGTRKKNQNTETGSRMLLCPSPGQTQGSLLGDAHQPASGYQ